MAPVPEGVELAEQATLLQGLGCEQGQRYYFARPAEPHVVERLLADHSGHGQLAA